MMTLRWYRALLELLPEAFRRRFAADMAADFEDLQRDLVHRHGRLLGSLVAWTWAMGDLVATAVRERRAAGRHRRGRRARRRLPTRERAFVVGSDFVATWRSLRHQPSSVLAAILALGLGIGLLGTTFAIANGTLWQPLPFPDSERLAHVGLRGPAGSARSQRVPYARYAEWREQQRSFVDLTASAAAVVSLEAAGDQPPEFAPAALVEPELIPLLGVEPILGRGFTGEDDRLGAPVVVLLGHGLWERRFGGDPDVLGRTIRIDLRRFSPGWRGVHEATVIGVMPPGFAFPAGQQAWLPLRLETPAATGDRGRLEVYGRLRQEASFASARAEMGLIEERLAAAHPDFPTRGAAIRPLAEPFQPVGYRRTVLLMLTGALLVLGVACANVSHLLLVRGARRGREIAVRAALGAGRGRLLAQPLLEALFLALAGALLGALLARFGVAWFDSAWRQTAEPPYWWAIRFDLVSIAAIAIVALSSALGAGLLPALRASGGRFAAGLRDGGRSLSRQRTHRTSRGLAIVEVALTTGLLFAAGLTLKSVHTRHHLDYGFAMNEVFTTRIGLWESGYPDRQSRQEFWGELERRIKEQNAAATALTSALPMDRTRQRPLVLDGEIEIDPLRPPVNQLMISADYFRAFGVDLLAGRDFEVHDDASQRRVAIVNRSFAERFFADAEPLGRRIWLPEAGAASMSESASDEAWTIVGMVPDLWVDGPENENPAGVYVPWRQADPRYLNVVLRRDAASGSDLSLISSQVRSQVSALDPYLATFQTGTVASFVDAQTWHYQVYGVFYLVFGFAALFLAALGIYGVLAFELSQRTAEIGLRMALGASLGTIVRWVVGRGTSTLATGMILGSGLALWLGDALSSVLFEVEPRDAGVALTVAAVLFSSGVVACLGPARRAGRVDPASVMRR